MIYTSWLWQLVPLSTALYITYIICLFRLRGIYCGIIYFMTCVVYLFFVPKNTTAYECFTKSCSNRGPASQTLGQRCTNIVYVTDLDFISTMYEMSYNGKIACFHTSCFPAFLVAINPRLWSSVCLMLALCLRRSASFKPTLAQCFVFFWLATL